ncbi:glucose dehydrogenase [FAD, quinone] [Orussus abietinus]|uniref:glucose dehydrogenase [FAD, quinone] n=1 Tax=Orussus abietinus TaxID=222816 RepID=UPI000624FE2D|nr:glucose dehydrogenase [FAD, quinone] [Orussus abietinus]
MDSAYTLNTCNVRSEALTCTRPFLGGPQLTDVCPGTRCTLFLTLLNTLVDIHPKIADPCGRVEPVKTPNLRYDFVVIGGGNAGAAIAGRLSEVPEWNVLLLEAGPDEPAGAEIPSNLQAFLDTELDWKYKTSNETKACQATGGVCSWPRGKNLGGCTVHHGMAYHRGNSQDYKRWVTMGNWGWSWNDVFPYFLLSEDNREINRVGSAYHSTGGPLPVERFPWQPDFAWDILEAGKEKGYKAPEDLIGDEITGFTVAQTISKNGVRVSSAASYLRPNRFRPNLHVALNATATKILFTEKKATGVQFRMNGLLRTVRVRREIVLSGGSVNSPQLLLLSGVGPADDLKALKIPVIQDLPGVGENLHNHVSYALDFTLNEPTERDLTSPVADQYLHNQTGPMSSTGLAQVTGVLASNYTSPDDPDLQFYFAGYQAACPGNPGISDIHSYDGKRTVRFTAVNIHPKSRGFIKLASKNPLEPPYIQSNDLVDPRDVQVLIDGLNIILSLANTTVMAKRGIKLATIPLQQCSNYEFPSDEYFNCAVHQDTRTENHQSGSCKMGPSSDPMAVVDPELKVHGVSGLRVADASIMPQVVSGNPSAPITMIGERAADFIKKEYGIPTALSENQDR